jgi:hypothetical protein
MQAADKATVDSAAAMNACWFTDHPFLFFARGGCAGRVDIL